MDARATLTQTQQDALWKWRWLGILNGTPAFKASLLILEVAAFALAVYWIVTR